MRYNGSVANSKQPSNPFYALLVIVGVAFSITACAYGVMVLKTTRVAVNGQEAISSQSGNDLMLWMDQNGMTAMGVELAILGLATVGAIWLDSHRAAREFEEQNDRRNSPL